MQETLLLFGWQLYEKKKCCNGQRKERYKNLNIKGISITIILNHSLFIVRRDNRTIHSSNAENLEEYLSKIKVV
jgi:hypothetical protein